MWKMFLMLNITIYRETKRKLFCSQTKTSGTVSPEVHNIYKGMDANVRPEKQLIKPLCTPVKLHVPTESKGQLHAKSNRVGIWR